MTACARRVPPLLLAIAFGLLFPSAGAAAPADTGKRAVEHAADLFRSGDADAAIAALRKMTESGSSSAEAYRLLGQIYFKGKKRPQEAVDAFTHALKLRPAYADALNDLAEVYVAQGKTGEAEQTLKRGLEVDPKHEDSYLHLARLYEGRREIPAAMNVYQRLLTVRPTSAEGLFGLAVLQEGQGHNKAARELLGRLTKAHPAHADGWYQAGRLAERSNDLLEAAYAYRQAIAAKPDLVDAHYNLGLFWLRRMNPRL